MSTDRLFTAPQTIRGQTAMDTDSVRQPLVVRGQSWGKMHIPADSSLESALCGAVPSCIGAFSHRGDRDQFEAISPQSICKRCRAREAGDAR